MIKIAMIGAGSVVFSKGLTGDILSYPEFKNVTLSYMDVDGDRLEVGADLCRKVAKELGANPKIEATLDRREALKDADFVINMVQIGGFDSTLVDFEIPRKYGLNFTIADTTGPGGVFRALRTFPMLQGMCRDMEEVCPNATLLNYSNPMNMNMLTVARTSGIKAVGLCHSVQGTLNQLMGYLGEKPEEIAFTCGGINHMAFYLKLEKDGEDLYPRLFEAMNDPKIYNTNKVRFELMKRFGYYVTESSEHNAEYSAHFIPHGAEVIEKFDVPIDEYLRRCDGIVDTFERMKAFSKSDEPIEVHRSHEYGSTIIHSVATGQPSVVYGNQPNRGSIANLPDDCIVEVPTLVDRAGLQPTTLGVLPPQLVGYMQPHITQQELFIQAATEGRRDHVYQAAMFDPLTAATMTTDKIVEMCDELIEAHGDLLPPLDAPTRVPSSGKSFSPPTPQELRASWDAAHEKAQKKTAMRAVSDWSVLGLFKLDEAETPLAATTPVEAELLATDKIDKGQEYSVGEAAYQWQSAPDSKGVVNLVELFGDAQNVIAYAYAEIESVHARETVLRCGSDDSLKVWLNGREVLAAEKGGEHQAGEVEAPVRLEAGANRVLVKLAKHNEYVAGWEFSVAVGRANF